MRDLIDLLNAREVRYALVGGHAVNYYGYVRATQDVDLLIYPSRGRAQPHRPDYSLEGDRKRSDFFEC